MMTKDRRKVFGLWVLIVVAMAGFAILDLSNLAQLNPNPLLIYNHIIGGVIFGVGMVLFGVVTTLANWVTNNFYLMEGYSG